MALCHGQRRRRVLVPRLPGVVIAVAVLTAACAGDTATDPATTSSTGRGPTSSSADPGPNPTTTDPGPNDTTDAPTTVQGTLRLDAGCVALETGTGQLWLRRLDTGSDDLGPGLSDPQGAVIARSGDIVFVTGYQRDDVGTCGTAFDVESLNSVIPAA